MTTEAAHRRPEIVSEGRLPAHGLPIPDDAICLDGAWDFRYWSGDEPAFPAPGSGATVPVPSSWVLHGDGAWGIPIYTNVIYPFPIDEYPKVPLPDEGGDHLLSVVVPAEWSDQRIVLRVGAAESALDVFIDGERIGFSTDSRLPAEFDLSDHVTAGSEVTIGLRVHRWGASTWLEDQDMWWMAGLHRSIHLYATPMERIDDVFYSTELISTPDNDSPGNESAAHVTVDVWTSGLEAGSALTVALGDDTAEAAVASDGSARARIEVAKPSLWSAEDPNLTTLTVSTSSGHSVTMAAGLRTVEVVNGQLQINGKAITIYGVNRHEHDPEHGRWQNDADMAADMALMKASNINAIRTAHYPNDERFYDMADELGFYVFDEANIETHGLVFIPDSLPANDPGFADAFVARGERMVLRDRNHPSVIAWSLGNEAGFGPNHRAMAAAMRAADTTRPIAYHPAEDDPVVDIIGPMYPPVDEMEVLVQTADDRPVIMCEYSHAMGNSNGGLDEYWNLIDRSNRAWGGFIWDWVDQGLALETENGTTWWAYGGDFGDEPNDRNFNCNGLVDADRRPHPALDHVAWVYRPVVTEPLDLAAGRVAARNRRSMINTGDLELHWSLVVDGRTEASGQVGHTPIDPDMTSVITIDEIVPAIATMSPAFDARVRIEWRNGAQLVAWDELPCPTMRPVAPPERSVIVSDLSANDSDPATPSIELLDEGLVLRGGGTEAHIDATGVPSEIRFGDQAIAINRGRLGIWRPPTDNDDATFGDEMLVTRLRKAGLDNATAERLREWRIDETGRGPSGAGSTGDGAVSATARFAFGTQLSVQLTWAIGPDGDLAFDMRARADLDLPPLLRLGFELELDGTFEHLEWLGPGPNETYPDRRDGLAVARHRSNATDSFFPYARPQETGNHTDLRWFAIRAGDGSDAAPGIVAVGDRRFDAAALHAWGEDISAARHPHEIEWSSGTVLRLDAAHAGLGTGSCGPGVAARHQVHPYHVRNRIIMRGVKPGEDAGSIAAPLSSLSSHRRWHY